MEMIIDPLAKGWFYSLGGAPKPLGELRPVVIFLERFFTVHLTCMCVWSRRLENGTVCTEDAGMNRGRQYYDLSMTHS